MPMLPLSSSAFYYPQLGLLVFDNVTELAQIQPCLPLSGSQFKVLITTKQSGLPFQPLPLGRLQPPAALKLLVKLLGDNLGERDIELAKQLCEYVDYLPFGLYQIAALRRQPGRVLC